MARLSCLPLLFVIACRAEVTPPPPADVPPTPIAPAIPAEPATPPPRATTSKGGIVEPRTVTSGRETSGEIRDSHTRADGSIAFEAWYRGNRLVRMRALAAGGQESWACELLDERRPRCVVNDERGKPYSDEVLASRNHDARLRLEAAQKLLAPPGGHGDEHAGHSHFKLAPPSKEAEDRWQAKRSAAWSDAAPWFERVEQLQTLGLPLLVATSLAKEELSAGLWVVPVKKPIATEHNH